jgi:hypothetical protein
MVGFAKMMVEPLTLNSAPMLSHVSLFTTVHSCAHKPSGIQSIRPSVNYCTHSLGIGLQL